VILCRRELSLALAWLAMLGEGSRCNDTIVSGARAIERTDGVVDTTLFHAECGTEVEWDPAERAWWCPECQVYVDSDDLTEDEDCVDEAGVPW